MSDMAIGALAPPRSLYPERRERREGRLDRLARAVQGTLVRRGGGLGARRFTSIVRRVEARRETFSAAGDEGLRAACATLSAGLRRGGLDEALAGEAFALIRETARRTIDVAPSEVEMTAGWAVLNGALAETPPDTDRALAAALAAATAALAGIPVHVVSADEYMARRDARRLEPLYQALGLTVGAVDRDIDAAQRRAAYRCSVVYATSAGLAFDYLRDRMVLGDRSSDLHLRLERLYGERGRLERLYLRGLCFAVIDDADIVLLDQALAPQVVAAEGRANDAERIAVEALELVEELEPEVHFRIDDGEGRVELTDAGRALIAELAAPVGGIWAGKRLREDRAEQALVAKHLFRPSEHYEVCDGKVRILDAGASRIAAGRGWADGLLQLIEAKEGCEVSGQRTPLARITFQRFFGRYQRVGGLAPTLREPAAELWSSYRLPVVSVGGAGSARGGRRAFRIYPTAGEKWEAVAGRVAELHRQGRPVLVGVASAESAAEIGERLASLGLEFEDAAAAEPEQAARMIAGAAAPGRITVATGAALRNVGTAGRGDRAGGVRVILVEPHEARRLDRQLLEYHSEAGGCERIFSLDDAVVAKGGGGWLRLARWWLPRAPAVGQWIAGAAVASAQRSVERQHAQTRRDLLRHDHQLSRMLAFSGRSE